LFRHRNPTTGIAGCCARAASGHAAAPPRSEMNSRRFIAMSLNPRTLRSIAGQARASQQKRPDRNHRRQSAAHVRFASESGRGERHSLSPLCAKSGHSHCSKSIPYSITSSARASSIGGTSMPSARAVGRLMTKLNVTDCTTGRSAGFSPLRIRSGTLGP